METNSYHLPKIPLSETDERNRIHAARHGYGASADYNGHQLRIEYLPHAVSGPKWTCAYYYGEWVRIANATSLKTVAKAAADYYNRPNVQRGTEIIFSVSPEAPESPEKQREIVEANGFVPDVARIVDGVAKRTRQEEKERWIKTIRELLPEAKDIDIFGAYYRATGKNFGAKE